MKEAIMELVKDMQENEFECLASIKRSAVRGALHCYQAVEGYDVRFVGEVIKMLYDDRKKERI